MSALTILGLICNKSKFGNSPKTTSDDPLHRKFVFPVFSDTNFIYFYYFTIDALY